MFCWQQKSHLSFVQKLFWLRSANQLIDLRQSNRWAETELVMMFLNLFAFETIRYEQLFAPVGEGDMMRSSVDSDEADAAEHDDEEDAAARAQNARRRRTSADKLMANSSHVFTARHTRLLSSLLTHIHLPGGSSVNLWCSLNQQRFDFWTSCEGIVSSHTYFFQRTEAVPSGHVWVKGPRISKQ